MLKILQARLQQYVNRELPDVQAGFRKGRGTRDQIANICWIMEKGREFQKNIYFCFIDYAKAFDCVDHNKLWKILKEMGIPDHSPRASHPGMWSQWALESITTNKASGGDRIPVELFQILKDDAVKVLHSICQQIWKTQQKPQDWKWSVFIPIPKKGNAKECSNCHTIALISHASKVMLKILQARLQEYMNRELPDVQAGFRKGRGTRD